MFWSLALPAVIVLALLSALSGLFGRPAHSSQFGAAGLLWSLVYVVLQFAAVVMYSVAWHRAYLVPADPMTPRAAYRWGPRQSKFLMAYFKLLGVFIPFGLVVGIVASVFFPVFVGGSVSTDTGQLAGQVIWFSWAMALVGMWIYARLSMMFPAAAVDTPSTLKTSWRMTKGNGLSLFWIVVLVAVPITGLSVLITGAIVALYQSTGAGSILTVNLLASLITIFMTFVGLAVGVSAMSICYKRLTDAGITGAAPAA
jgi:hypothetical protein